MNPSDIAKVLNKIGDILKDLRIASNTIENAIGLLENVSIDISRLSNPEPVIVDVPYRSQHDKDAQLSRADCGPACVAMLLQWGCKWRNYVAIDDITKIAGLDPTNAQELKIAAAHWELKLTHKIGVSPHEIEDWLDSGHPMIALVDYERFGEIRQDLKYNLLHWVVVVGYDAQSFYINDPNYWGESRLLGCMRAIPRDTFIDAQDTMGKGAHNRQVLVA